MLKKGLYEQVINQELNKEICSGTDTIPFVEPIDQEEAPKIIAKYLAEIIENELFQIKGESGEGIQKQIVFANDIVKTIERDSKLIDIKAEMLMAIIDKMDNAHGVNEKNNLIRPTTSIAQSSLFTGSIHEPSMYSELKKEISSCDRIDMLVSFIKWSGLRLIINELSDFTSKGGMLRVITTSYMGATDLKAIEELRKLSNTQIKISYNTKQTRLHAKTYIFYRETGFTTAYIGSSNLSNAAISSGLEWNVKITAKDLLDTITKVNATFESYWNSREFIFYSEEEKPRLERALFAERDNTKIQSASFNFDIFPYPFQQEVLDKLNAEREIRGFTRNLVVAATGTGKTVISAFDYKRFCDENRGKRNRFLFVAHREEILKQSISCFRSVLHDANFGDLFVGNYKPANIEHLFISIQTFNSQSFHGKTKEDYYDYIVVDEFHHAAAATYQKLLTYYNPQILLGLTATPERMDGKSITHYFNNRIAAEIRLPEAIDRKLLSPFQYFGVTDSTNLEDIKWSRGGYEKSDLSKIYTGNDFRANMIIKSLLKYITDIHEVKGLGFCVSKDHAEYVSMVFNTANIASMFLTSDSSDEDRHAAKRRLADGLIRFIFVVDLYNEGVDIPEINTILFLRPTESLTVFLQQLGRGLRLSKDKECLTVLDFIAQANKKYNFEDKFKALLGNTTKSLQKEIRDGFVSLPKGCYIQLEKIATDYILDNIRYASGSGKNLVTRIANFENDTGNELTLSNFIHYYHLDVRQIYKNATFSRLRVLAGVREDFNENLEDKITKAMSKICVIDSRRWICYLLEALPIIENIKPNAEEYRMLNMFHYTIFLEASKNIIANLTTLKNNPTMFAEILDLLAYQYSQIDFVDSRINLGFDCPLDVHCTYTRDQILIALDFLKPNTVREGVKYLPDKKIDVLFVTLNKSDKDYSPTTMYNDYSISEDLFHWQSQSTTSCSSPTGQRYIDHAQNQSEVILFVREFKKDIAGASPYTFLGKCDFVRNEGSKPMNITWKLQKDIPAKYYKKTNKLVVG